MKDKITVIDSLMGSGKSSWVFEELFNNDLNTNLMYVTPLLSEIEKTDGKEGRIPQLVKDGIIKRRIYSPANHGFGKLANLIELIEGNCDIASTHALFRLFDDDVKSVLKANEYTLILDECITPIEPFHFKNKDDFQFLLDKRQIEVTSDGLIRWIGSNADISYNEIRTLARNKSLFVIDNKCYLWHFPVEIFKLFKRVYILTYMFNGSLLKPYFDLYGIEYETKSIRQIDGHYTLTDYFEPNKSAFRDRFNVYEGKLNLNIDQKPNALSASWFKSAYHNKDIEQLRNNLFNFSKNICKADSKNIMWSTYSSSDKRKTTKSPKQKLSQKGYSRAFVACNCRATNDFDKATCLMYALNFYEHPEIVKFFQQRNIRIDQDKLSLSTLLQWIWRSNIRVTDSKETINIYLPSSRMRKLFTEWLAS